MANELTHRVVRTNGIDMHVAEQGSGPLVLLIHGFPGLWASWKNQIAELAKHGYHVVAPDMRGYGDTESPTDPTSYSIFHLVGDLVGLLQVLGHQQAFVVGHDWGAVVAWHLCLFRPDMVKALVNLGVPFWPRSPNIKPKTLRQKFGDGFYISQFQEPGRAEKAFGLYDHLTLMKKFHLIDKPDLIAPPGMEIIDFLDTPSSLPAWITEEELQYFASKFQKSGFTGPLNYYRAMDLNWELLAPWQGSKISVPTKFIAGDKDIGFHSFGIKDYIMGSDFKRCVPNVEVVVIDGYHFIQQEKAKEVTNEILSFLANFSNV
ncbi:uncharacterized protein LOC131233156 [Magnolia sinica]|uniref:uncharacterized protein LOC131233156 n=1 Tax=Magnolia sinica TaxID=86752 RepID=UPI002659B0BA|nr:uncharacterized protein LOC131233156 [Magnolia sinica]